MTLTLADIGNRIEQCTQLDGASLTLERSKVRALVGENGAGKTTLIRVAGGLLSPQRGTLAVDGTVRSLRSARDATALGIGVVHQHFMLVDTLTVAENVFLGAEPRTGPFGLYFDRSEANARVKALSEKYSLPIDPTAMVERLAVGERQRVELLKVLARGAKYLLLDEPTAVLSPLEIASLLEIIRNLAAAGAAVLFVSHKLDEVLAVADDVTVLRRGRVTLDKPRSAVTAEEIARAVVGDTPPSRSENTEKEQGKALLVLKGARAEGLSETTLTVHEGEIVGVAGVEGSGQARLLHAIAGLTKLTAGTVSLAGEDLADKSVLARREKGLGFVPEDRERTGLLPELSIVENLALGDSARPRAEQRARAEKLVKDYDVRPAEIDAAVRTLSGGNAQKVLVARELSRTLSALCVAQPTRGVDLGAAAVIHRMLREERARGCAVLLVSSELDELRSLSDRIVVMRGGAVVAELAPSEASDAKLGALMVGSGDAA